jgi:hypothetical protein
VEAQAMKKYKPTLLDELICAMCCRLYIMEDNKGDTKIIATFKTLIEAMKQVRAAQRDAAKKARSKR